MHVPHTAESMSMCPQLVQMKGIMVGASGSVVRRRIAPMPRKYPAGHRVQTGPDEREMNFGMGTGTWAVLVPVPTRADQ